MSSSGTIVDTVPKDPTTPNMTEDLKPAQTTVSNLTSCECMLETMVERQSFITYLANIPHITPPCIHHRLLLKLK
jgi:hypothetical protein